MFDGMLRYCKGVIILFVSLCEQNQDYRVYDEFTFYTWRKVTSIGIIEKAIEIHMPSVNT